MVLVAFEFSPNRVLNRGNLGMILESAIGLADVHAFDAVWENGARIHSCPEICSIIAKRLGKCAIIVIRK